MVQAKLRFIVLGFSLILIMLWLGSSALAAQSQSVADDDDTLEQPLPPGIEVRAFIHRPRVVEHNHLGTCTTTTDDAVTDYGLAGWHLPAGISPKLNESTDPLTVGVSAARTAIQNSFATWEQRIGNVFSDVGSTNAKNTRFDGTNAIMWKRLGASTIGVTYVWYSTSTKEVVEVDTAFNSRYPWAIFDSQAGECQSTPDAYDVQNIATHEFGHWVGLEDLYDDADKDLTMYGFGAGGELKKRTLGAGDKAGADAVAP
jgi:hypothetical protein